MNPDIKPIGYVRSEFHEKFGIPRQSGLVDSVFSAIYFEPEYSGRDAFRGLEEFSHIWVLWQFSECRSGGISLTVRPPKLGGNTRMGVFATRSPFRPNPIGLSCVRLERISFEPKSGTVLIISGADIMDGTPIYDIKPYLPYTDCRPEANGGFTDRIDGKRLEVCISDEAAQDISEDAAKKISDVISLDPRPSYQHEPDRVYGLDFAGCSVKFTVDGKTAYVISIKPLK